MSEQRRTILDEYVNGEAITKFTELVMERLNDIRTITDPPQRSDATDQLIEDLPGMLSEVDVFDRVNVSEISGQLKNIYDQDMGWANVAGPGYLLGANQRAIALMEMRRDVNEANKMFGVLELATRQYVTPLVPTPQEAELLRTAGNLDEIDYVIMEHYGDGWEDFLKLNRPLGEWQEYISAYYDQIMSKLHPLNELPRAPSSPVNMPDQIPAPPVVIARERSIAAPSTIKVGTGGVNDYLVAATGLQSRLEGAPPGGVVAAPDVRTGDRDARRRSLTVPANLNGLAQWVEATYRTQGDIVQVTKSPEGGVISLVITGDVSHWTRCLDSMRIPVPLVRSVDDNNNTLTVSYV